MAEVKAYIGIEPIGSEKIITGRQRHWQRKGSEQSLSPQQSPWQKTDDAIGAINARNTNTRIYLRLFFIFVLRGHTRYG